MTNSTVERTGLLRIVMERDFEEFGSKEREAFLRDLATITGLESHQFTAVAFRPGCVLAELRLPEHALEALVDAYAAAKSGNHPEKLLELQGFLLKYNIKNINGEFEVALQIQMRAPPIDAPAGSQEILFIHGFTGDKTTFGKLPEFLAKTFDCKTRSFEYPTGWMSDSPSIYFLAQGFDTWFRNTVEAERVSIISHSMGGLVARKFVTLQAYRRRPIDTYVAQMTFVASPHDGANLASIGKRIPGLASSQIHDLSPTSGFTAELKEAWLAWLARNPRKTRHIRSVFSPADSVVDPPNAMGGTGDGDTILGESHTGIVKPADPKAQIVLTLTRHLREAGFSLHCQ